MENTADLHMTKMLNFTDIIHINHKKLFCISWIWRAAPLHAKIIKIFWLQIQNITFPNFSLPLHIKQHSLLESYGKFLGYLKRKQIHWARYYKESHLCLKNKHF